MLLPTPVDDIQRSRGSSILLNLTRLLC